MSSWSQTLRNNAGTLRWLAGRLEADPLRPVYGNLDEVWVGPAATHLADGAAAKDRDADAVGDELRRIAAALDRRAGEIEAAEQAAAQAAADAAAAQAAAAAGPPASPPPSWY